MEYILSIDQGTTGTRAMLYDRSGNVKAGSYEEFPQYFPKPGWVEHDPAEIWESVNNSIQKVLKKVPNNKIAAIGITNQRETTIVWDRLTGKPVYNAIVWQCRRTSERCYRLKSNSNTADIFKKRTGLPIDAYFSATKLEWILKHVNGALAKAKKGRLLFGTPDTWVLWNLTGGKVHATDYTNASRTMLFNINNLEWDRALLKKFNVPLKMLPAVKRSSGEFGRTKNIGRLPEGIPITGIAGDQQASLFGQACFAPGTVKNTYGTGSFILLNTGRRKPVSKHGLIVTLGCGGKGEPVYVLEGAIFITGAAIHWLRDGLKLLSCGCESEKMATSIEDNDGVYFVPALVGLGAPYWDQEARGAIYGITRGTKGEHIVRAALEAMCYQAKDVMNAMERDTCIKIKNIKIDGGASVNNFLCQFQADILGMDVIRPKVTETTSKGAAYLAGLAVGYWKDSGEIIKSWKIGSVFKPKMDNSKSMALYKGWLKAVERTLS